MGLFEFDLVADPGYQVNLASFDMANWGDYSQTISSLSVQDGNGNNLYFQPNVLVPGTLHTHYTFTMAAAPVVKILFDASVGVDADDVCIDNITFSQQPGSSTIPEPTTMIIWLLLGGVGITVAWWRQRAG